jgi:hypothetical protein
MLSPEEVDTVMNGENSPELERIAPLYETAMPNLKKAWVPIMVQADVLERLLHH